MHGRNVGRAPSDAEPLSLTCHPGMRLRTSAARAATVPGRSSCISCSTGQYQPYSGSTSCSYCPSGQTSYYGASTSSECYFDQSDSCYSGGSIWYFEPSVLGHGIGCLDCCFYQSQQEADQALLSALWLGPPCAIKHCAATSFHSVVRVTLAGCSLSSFQLPSSAVE